jgi:hypothetical protein
MKLSQMSVDSPSMRPDIVDKTPKNESEWDGPSSAIESNLTRLDRWKRCLVFGRKEQNTSKDDARKFVKWKACLAAIDSHKKDKSGKPSSPSLAAEWLTKVMLPGMPKLC